MRPYGDPTGIRTRVTAVKGRCLNRLTIGPLWLRGPDLNRRPPGYEPDELPAALPRDNEIMIIILLFPGSWGGARTHNLPVNSRLLRH